MKKVGLIIVLVNFLVLPAMAQEYKNDFNFSSEFDTLVIPEKNQRLTWDTNLGSSFIYSKAFGSATEFFAAPQVNYGITPKFAIHGGLMFSYTSVFGQSNSDENGYMMPIAFPGMSVYGSASYRLNKNVTFYGTGIRHMSNFYSKDAPAFLNKPYNSYSFGSSIRLGNKVTIGASLHVNDRNKYNSPFLGPSDGAYYSPFYW